MNKVLLSLTALALSITAQGQITWSAPITVTTGGAYGAYHPRIALNRSGNPYVLWGKNDTKAYFSKLSGTAFTTPVAVSDPYTVFAQSWAGPDLAAYGDTVYVTMKVKPEDVATNHMYLAHSYNGGATFSAPVRIDNIDTSLSRFPIVTTTDDGNPMVAFMKFNTAFGDAHYRVARSTDFGASFTADVLASGPAGTVCDCCPAAVIATGTSALMLFRNDMSNIRDIWAGVSVDGGTTFPTVTNIDSNNWMIMSCPASGPDGVVIGDSLYSVYMSKPGGTQMVYFSRMSLTGLYSASSPITGVFTGLNQQNYPRIANSGNAVGTVFYQKTTAGSSIAFGFANNITSGYFTTFDTIATGVAVANADIALAPGEIHVVWQDGTGTVKYKKGTYGSTTAVLGDLGKTKIDIYPNPSTNTILVSLNGVGQINHAFILDATGRKYQLQADVKSNVASFSVAHLAKGLYYFIMQDDRGKEYFSKLQVQ